MSCLTSGLVWERMQSNFFQSSTLSTFLIILGIFFARHYLEEFNRIKGLLLKPIKDTFSAKKCYAWLWKDKEVL